MQPLKAERHILVVEDDNLYREALKRMLQSAGMKVTAARSGVEALKFLSSGTNFDLILTDMTMPEGDGLFVLDAIREKSKNIPALIFITGLREASLADYLELGAKDVLSKPCPKIVLLNSIERAIGSKQAV